MPEGQEKWEIGDAALVTVGGREYRGVVAGRLRLRPPAWQVDSDELPAGLGQGPSYARVRRIVVYEDVMRRPADDA